MTSVLLLGNFPRPDQRRLLYPKTTHGFSHPKLSLGHAVDSRPTALVMLVIYSPRPREIRCRLPMRVTQFGKSFIKTTDTAQSGAAGGPADSRIRRPSSGKKCENRSHFVLYIQQTSLETNPFWKPSLQPPGTAETHRLEVNGQRTTARFTSRLHHITGKSRI